MSPDRNLTHVEVRLSPGADTTVHHDNDGGMPMVLVVGGPADLIVCPAELDGDTLTTLDELADAFVWLRDRARKLVVEIDAVPPTDVTEEAAGGLITRSPAAGEGV